MQRAVGHGSGAHQSAVEANEGLRAAAAAPAAARACGADGRPGPFRALPRRASRCRERVRKLVQGLAGFRANIRKRLAIEIEYVPVQRRGSEPPGMSAE